MGFRYMSPRRSLNLVTELLTSEPTTAFLTSSLSTASERLLSSVDTDLQTLLGEEIGILVAVLAAWALLYMFNFHVYYRRLRDEIWQTDGMVNLLPFHTILENPNIYSRVISWGDY